MRRQWKPHLRKVTPRIVYLITLSTRTSTRDLADKHNLGYSTVTAIRNGTYQWLP